MRAATRKRLPRSKFGLPRQRKYPVDTKKRAANAKARATQQYRKGRISKSQRAQINRKANARLRRKR